MNKLNLFLLLSMISTALAGCGDRMSTIEVPAVSTSAPGVETPTNAYVINTTDKKNKLWRGNLSTSDIKIKIDQETKKIRMTGRVLLKNRNSEKYKESDITLEGNYDEHGLGVLKPVDKSMDNQDLKIRSKITCFDDESSNCSQVVADLFVHDKETDTYNITQVETKKDLPKEPKKENVDNESDKNAAKNTDKDSNENNQNKQNASEPDEEEGYEGTPDLYISQIYTNFENLFDDSKTLKEEKLDEHRPYDQSYGQANGGKLKNATDLLEQIKLLKKDSSSAPFIDVPNFSRQRYFGTYELVELVLKMGDITHNLNLGYKLQVSDLSQKTGGPLKNSKHKSHQNGIDIDIGYFVKDIKKDSGFPTVVEKGALRSDFLAEQVLILLNNTLKMSNGGIDRIFVNKTIKAGLCAKAVQLGLVDSTYKTGDGLEILRRLRKTETDHDDHFHLRIKCSKYQPHCRQMAEPPAGAGC